MATAMENLREVCENICDGKFPKGFTLVNSRQLIDLYNGFVRGESGEFIAVEIARLLESLGIRTVRKGIGWEAYPPKAA